MASDMTQVSIWFWEHHLFLNLDETKFIAYSFNNRNRNPLILFEGIKVHTDCAILNVNYSYPTIIQVNKVRYLGLIFDSHLSWNKHTKLVQSRTKSANYMLYHLSKQYSRNHLWQIYLALYEPILQFGMQRWEGTLTNLIQPIVTLQKKAIRAIAGIRSRGITLDLGLKN